MKVMNERGDGMARILIGAVSEKLVMNLRQLLSANGHTVLAASSNEFDLSRQVLAQAPDVVVIDEKLGASCAALVDRLTQARQGVLFLGKAYQQNFFQTSPYLAICQKPVQPTIFLTTLDLLHKYTIAMKALETKIDRLENSQKEEKIMRQAKNYLQKQDGMSEPEAHRYLQTRSMELRISKLELAKRLIKQDK